MTPDRAFTKRFQSPTAPTLQLLHALWCCSRCTGYRPILDAFKVFAKADPAAYTEESIAASRGMQLNGQASDALSAHEHGNSNGAMTNGHTANGQAHSRSADRGHKAEQPAENGHCGYDAGKGTVKELNRASNGSKVLASSPALPAWSDCSQRPHFLRVALVTLAIDLAIALFFRCKQHFLSWCRCTACIVLV